MMSPAEIASLNRAIRGAMSVATSTSFRLKPHRATMFAIPILKTSSALPIEKPPPMNDADSVAKITSDPYERWATEKWVRFLMPRPLHSPIARITAR